MRPGHGLTPPIEEQEQVEAKYNKRDSLSSFGGILGGKNKSKDSIGVKTSSHAEQAVNRDKNEGTSGDQLKLKDNAVPKANVTRSHGNEGRNGGRD